MLVCLATLIVQALPANSTPIRPIAQMVHTQWITRDGVPGGVRALAQSNDGYLWLGGSRGLHRFDGVRFVHLVPPDTTLTDKGVRRLVASREGGVWIVWSTGAVSRLRDHRWTTWRHADGLPVVTDLAESSTGTVVAATLEGLSRLDGPTWTDVRQEWRYPGSQSQAVWFDRDDGLWSETESRVVYLSRGSDRFTDPGMPLARTAVQAQFAQEEDGTIWMNEYNRSVHALRRAGDHLPESEVIVPGWSIVIDRRGSLWIGTIGEGLRRIADPSRVRGKVVARFGAEAESFKARDGLLADVVYALLEDRDGSIWVASDGGVERFSEGAFTSTVTPGGTRNRSVFSARDSTIWINAYGQSGIARIDPSTGSIEEIGKGSFSTSLYQDRSGTMWRVNGIMPYRYSEQRRDFLLTALRRNDAKSLRDVVVDSAGTAWFVDETEGLMRIAGDSLVTVVSLPPSISPTAALLYDRGGRIWIRRQDGLSMYERGELRVFDASRSEIPSTLSSVLEDRAGNIWLTSQSGLSRLEGDRFRTLSERQGVPERVVWAAAEDSDRAWWLVTRTGVLRLPPGELDKAMADTSHVLRYRQFDARDGIAGTATSIVSGTDGRIWFGTSSGVSSVNPRSLLGSAVPPVLIEGVRVDDRDVPLSDAVRIPPNGRDFEIDYTSTALRMADRVQFRYQLDGEDPEWRDVGSRRRAYYSRLAPGQYTFRVTASNGDGNWNEAPAVLRFRVLPAWHQTRFFQGSVVLFILGIGAAIAWIVQRQRQQQMRQVLMSQHRATLAERTRLAGELHDTLLQAFTGVTLQLQAMRRRILSSPREAEEDLARMLQVADFALRDARSAVWDLRAPGLEDCDVATALEQSTHEAISTHRLAGGAPVDVEVTIIGDRRRLSPAVEACAHRVGREAVANALRHAEAKSIRLAIAFEPSRLCVDVRDDGIGFELTQLKPAEGRGHWGLVGMGERARNVLGTLDITSAPGSGTAVLLRVPVEPA